MLILDTEYTQGGGKLSRGQRLQAGIVGLVLRAMQQMEDCCQKSHVSDIGRGLCHCFLIILHDQTCILHVHLNVHPKHKEGRGWEHNGKTKASDVNRMSLL